MYSVAFNWAWQHFAAKGYAVFYMNPRGSTGYGQRFIKASGTTFRARTTTT